MHGIRDYMTDFFIGRAWAKEKDLMVGQIGFLWGGYGWMGLCKIGWMGLGGDNRNRLITLFTAKSHDGLDVRGLREHIHGLNGFDFVGLLDIGDVPG